MVRAGEVIDDRFEILESAGSGGMGVVHRAQDRATHRHVAVKILLERSGPHIDRFEQEVRLLSGLEHPHIVSYIAHGTTDAGAPYLVMPWLHGQDLQAHLHGGPLSVEDTLKIARQVADALAYLHGRGIVHRDLKPSNLFLSEGRVDEVKVIDMGIARATTRARPLTGSGVLLGTPGFIAPEQALDQHEIAPTVDVFALGCVLFECLTGKRLFDGPHIMAILAKILIEEAPRIRELRADVPDALDRLVHRMVSKEPRSRPQDGAELSRWLEELAYTSIRSTPPPAITAKERRVVSILVVVLPQDGQRSSAPTDATAVGTDALQAAAQRLRIRLQLLDARTAIGLAPRGLGAADQASVLARLGRSIVEAFSGSRVAIATGIAFTGGHLPVGEAIDRGVSLVREATSDEGVFVDDVTAALITTRFDLRRLDGRVVVSTERLSLDPTRPLLGQPTSCVGRDREIAMLEVMFAEATDGVGPRAALVTAPAGMGKSRVRHEFVRRLRASSASPIRVLQCRGDPLHVTTPYAQIAQAIRQAVGLAESEPVAVAREKLVAHVTTLLVEDDALRVRVFLGELLGIAFDDDGYLPLRAARQSADAMADQMRRAFTDAMRAWCRRCPLVLMLEDLHWADAMSVALLDAALRKLQGERLFVVGLARPEVHDRFRDLLSKRHATEIRLPPLPPRDCAELVREVLGATVLTQDIGQIVERSEGNPFYLEELIRAAAGEPGRDGTLLPRSDNALLPQTVLAMAQARLERLGPTERKILRAASVFGEVFSVEGVTAVAGEDASFGAAFASLIENEAILPSEHPGVTPGREFEFRHVFLRGAAYASLTDDDRALGHRLAAQWLERNDEDREIVGLHWLEAGERTRAATAFAQAGEGRLQRAQAEAAARCAVRSLLVAEPHGEEPEALSARIRLLADALQASRRIVEHDVLVGLERHVAFPTTSGHGSHAAPTIAHVVLDRCLEALRATQQTNILANGLARSARALAALSDFTRARELLAEATAIAEENVRLRDVRYEYARIAFLMGEYGDLMEIITTTVLPADARQRLEILLQLATAVVVVDGRESLPRGLDFVVRAEALAVQLGRDPVALVQCAKARLLCFGFARDYTRACSIAENAVALSREAGLRYEECLHLHNVGDMRLRLGEVERARATLEASSALAAEIGAERVRRHNEVLIAYLDANPSRIEELAEAYCAADDRWHELHARYWLGRCLATVRPTRARHEVVRALDLARKLKVRMVADECELALAELS